MKRKRLLTCAGILLTATTAHQALAVTSSGTIGATLTLTNGCLINGSPTQNGINFGTLDFGTHPATFSTLTTQLTGASGGNTFTIQCTTASYTVAITGNTNSTAPGTVVGTTGTPARYLINTTNTGRVWHTACIATADLITLWRITRHCRSRPRPVGWTVTPSTGVLPAAETALRWYRGPTPTP